VGPERKSLSCVGGSPGVNITARHRRFRGVSGGCPHPERVEPERKSLSCARGPPDFHATGRHRRFRGVARLAVDRSVSGGLGWRARMVVIVSAGRGGCVPPGSDVLPPCRGRRGWLCAGTTRCV
jgi:hypothetical protein